MAAVTKESAPMTDASSGTGPVQHGQEFEFMVADRRRKLAGFWAAELLGLIGQAGHDYVRKLRNARRAHAMDDDDMLLEELHKDLNGKASHGEIRDKIGHFLQEARRQLLHEKKDRR